MVSCHAIFIKIKKQNVWSQCLDDNANTFG